MSKTQTFTFIIVAFFLFNLLLPLSLANPDFVIYQDGQGTIRVYNLSDLKEKGIDIDNLNNKDLSEIHSNALKFYEKIKDLPYGRPPKDYPSMDIRNLIISELFDDNENSIGHYMTIQMWSDIHYTIEDEKDVFFVFYSKFSTNATYIWADFNTKRYFTNDIYQGRFKIAYTKADPPSEIRMSIPVDFLSEDFKFDEDTIVFIWKIQDDTLIIEILSADSISENWVLVLTLIFIFIGVVSLFLFLNYNRRRKLKIVSKRKN